MKKLIYFLFGKPFKKENTFLSKYFRFAYWGMIAFYVFSLIILGLAAVYNPNTIINLIIWAIFIPAIFRLTYSLVGKVNNLEKDA
ncbi:hypothetical protein [Bacillus marasmi]|uniref:hypothetical protein n=1 Tax=Bacillus marasmi TaxID=1926279 RepID=UPI0011C82140|nr:hypothetical protein [Bacillus marasmi]